MKTLVFNGYSIYKFEDTDVIAQNGLETSVYKNGDLVLRISDMNNANSTIFEGVTVPTDWAGHKYKFDGETWTQNPDWVDPEATD